jgi:hypothetical protein
MTYKLTKDLNKFSLTAEIKKQYSKDDLGGDLVNRAKLGSEKYAARRVATAIS